MPAKSATRSTVEVLAGFFLCFLLTTAWDFAAVQLYGHRGGPDKPFFISLALSFVVQTGCVLALWRRWRPVAIGFLIYMGVEALWIVMALTVFHRS